MKKSKIQIYRDRKREFRWRLLASNGRIIADCAEGFGRRRGVIASVKLLLKAAGNYCVVEHPSAA